jgi:hypothetical protein
MEPGTSGSVARNSDHKTKAAVRHYKNKMKLGTTEMSTLRKILRETRLDRVRSQDIRIDVEYTVYSHIDKSKPVLFSYPMCW